MIVMRSVSLIRVFTSLFLVVISFGAMAAPGEKLECPPGAVFCSDFEDSSWLRALPRSVCMGNPPGSQAWFPSFFRKTHSGERLQAEAKSGHYSLAFRNRFEKHGPAPYSFAIDPAYMQSDTMYLRWNLKYEPKYEFDSYTGVGEVKSAGIGFSDNHCGHIHAGRIPNGRDQYSANLEVTALGYKRPKEGKPHLYVYHPGQLGGYGDDLMQNQGNDIIFTGGQWYEIQIMLKTNKYPKCDGEVKLWINDELRAHHTGFCFRTDNTKKINQINLSAWFGGVAPSPRNQYQYIDDVIVSPMKIN